MKRFGGRKRPEVGGGQGVSTGFQDTGALLRARAPPGLVSCHRPFPNQLCDLHQSTPPLSLFSLVERIWLLLALKSSVLSQLLVCAMCSVVSDSLQPHTLPGSSVRGISQARILE